MFDLSFIIKEILSDNAFISIINNPCDWQDCYDCLKRILKKYIR